MNFVCSEHLHYVADLGFVSYDNANCVQNAKKRANFLHNVALKMITGSMFFTLHRWYWIAGDLIDMSIQIIHDKHFHLWHWNFSTSLNTSVESWWWPWLIDQGLFIPVGCILSSLLRLLVQETEPTINIYDVVQCVYLCVCVCVCV